MSACLSSELGSAGVFFQHCSQSLPGSENIFFPMSFFIAGTRPCFHCGLGYPEWGNRGRRLLSVLPQRSATAASQMNSSLQIISSVDTRPVAFQLKSRRLSSTPSSEREATGRALSRKGAATKRLKTLQSKPRRTFLGAVRGCRPLGQGPLVLSISNALYATGFLPALAALREQYPR